MEYRDLFSGDEVNSDGDIPPLAERIEFARRVIAALPPDVTYADLHPNCEYSESLRLVHEAWLEGRRTRSTPGGERQPAENK